MVLNTKCRNLICVVFLFSALSGCAIKEGARTGLRALAETEGMIAFSHSSFNGLAKERILYADMSERDEYALFQSPDQQAEFVYITTRHIHMTNLVVDQMFNLDMAMQKFRHNQHEIPISGDAFKLKLHGIRYWARSFQLTQAGKSCGVFSGSWDAPADELRPSKALFGYFCEKGKAPLSVQKIEQIMSSIGLRGLTIDPTGPVNFVPIISEIPSQSDLQARVQGTANGYAGNSAFPYKVVRYYKRDDACLYDPNC